MSACGLQVALDDAVGAAQGGGELADGLTVVISAGQLGVAGAEVGFGLAVMARRCNATCKAIGTRAMITSALTVVTIVAIAGLIVLVLVITAVKGEDCATRLPVEAPGPVTAFVRRVLGMHVSRSPVDIPDPQPSIPTRRY